MSTDAPKKSKSIGFWTAVVGAIGAVAGGGHMYVSARADQVASARVEERVRQHDRELRELGSRIDKVIDAQQKAALDLAVIRDRLGVGR